MDDPLGFGTLLAVGIDVRHDVVTDLFFTRRGDVVIDIVGMGAQFLELTVGNREAELLLRLGERDPQPPPGPEFVVG